MNMYINQLLKSGYSCAVYVLFATVLSSYRAFCDPVSIICAKLDS
jgi:hypothetical protein